MKRPVGRPTLISHRGEKLVRRSVQFFPSQVDYIATKDPNLARFVRGLVDKDMSSETRPARTSRVKRRR